MWEIYEHRRVARQISTLSTEVLKRYEKWKDVVALSGPEALRKIKGLHDEALRGEWRGFRSSRLNRQYRVIYKVEKDRILVKVVNITPHDYRRR